MPLYTHTALHVSDSWDKLSFNWGENVLHSPSAIDLKRGFRQIKGHPYRHGNTLQLADIEFLCFAVVCVLLAADCPSELLAANVSLAVI